MRVVLDIVILVLAVALGTAIARRAMRSPTGPRRLERAARAARNRRKGKP